METMTVASLDDLDVTDPYTEALTEVISAKAEHRKPTVPEGGEPETAAGGAAGRPLWRLMIKPDR
ncbi:hypothetical protein [Streptomyces sp. NPDC001809]